MRRVVVGLHDDAAARQALRWANQWATRTGATLEVVTAIPYHRTFYTGYEVLMLEDIGVTTAIRDHQRRIVADTLGPHAADPHVECRIVRCAPVDGLVTCSTGADLLVIGQRRHRGGPFWWRAIARRCESMSECPVVLVHEDLPVAHSPKWTCPPVDAGASAVRGVVCPIASRGHRVSSPRCPRRSQAPHHHR